ncbi:hypothetical protein GQ53DRAFT_746853 [Thozetella sp. PMI_491]|nr:hypothetical protein GQ53DRAFT_746853 [Thozetella sp. PMI_491]
MGRPSLHVLAQRRWATGSQRSITATVASAWARQLVLLVHPTSPRNATSLTPDALLRRRLPAPRSLLSGPCW